MRLICHKCTNYFLLRNFFFTFFTLSIAYPSSHIQLRQLADFPSLILRSRFGGGILNFELWGELAVRGND